MEITYDTIKSLIVSEEIEGPMIKLKFKAANQETPIDSVAYVAPDQDEIMKNMQKQMGKTIATGMAINTASSAIGGLLGGVGSSIAGVTGSLASTAVTSGMMDPMSMMSTEMTDEKKQAAIVQAFGYLSMYYTHNGTDWEFVPPAE